MPVRKTESRLPIGFQASDLGQAVVADDARCALISFATAPVVVARDNAYVLLVTDAALASSAQSFEWTFKENGDVTRIDATERADALYQPSIMGSLSVGVRVLDSGNAEQAALSLEQEVVLPSAELETLIADAQNRPGPGASDPDVLRELVNQHCRYYQQVTLQIPEAGDGFLRFLFSMVSDGAARHTASERREHIDQLATALNEQPEEFARLAATGAGVCNIRLALLAMALPRAPGGTTPVLPWTELPEPDHQRAFAEEQLRQSLAALSEDARIDLFNIARFPKSNIAACGRILEMLRNRYFAGTNFNDVLTGMSGTRAHWIIRHFLEGPITRA
jgi:hypothetical protein